MSNCHEALAFQNLSVNWVKSFIFQAYCLLGQFLILKKDEEMFTEWYKETTKADKKKTADCCTCLKEWCEAFL